MRERPSCTSSPRSDASGCAGSDPNTSTASTTACSTPATAGGPSPPRPSTRSTSSSAAPSRDAVAPRAASPATSRLLARRTPAAVDPQDRTQTWTAEQLRTVPARRRWTPPVPRPVALRHDRHATQRTARPAMDRHRLRQAPPARSTAGLVAIGYELHESRGKTRNSRRTIDLDPTTIDRPRRLAGLPGRRVRRRRHQRRRAGCSPTPTAEPVHPHALSQTFDRIVRRAGVPVIRLHDLRHTHGTPAHQGPASRSRWSANDSVTPTSSSPSRPTNTSCPACKPTPPAPSKGSSPPVPPADAPAASSRRNTRKKTA